MKRPASAWLSLAAGLLLVVVARVAIPTAPPLYDGVVVIPPYRWLDPPPGQQDGADGASTSVAVKKHQSPLIALATPEEVPQAQVFAAPDELTLPDGARRVEVSIEPVAATGTPEEGHIDGNVYRIVVTDDRGRPLTAPASSHVSIVLRATDLNAAEGSIARFSDGEWDPIKTSSGGFGGTFLAVVREFGDFAVIAPGPGPSRPSSPGGSSPPTPVDVVQAPLGTAISSIAPTGAGSSPVSSAAGPDSLVPGVISIGAIALVAIALGGAHLARRRRRNARDRGAQRVRRD